MTTSLTRGAVLLKKWRLSLPTPPVTAPRSLLEAMVAVIGDEAIGMPEVYKRLRALPFKISSADPKKYLQVLLSRYGDLFPRATTSEGRRVYRAVAAKLPKRPENSFLVAASRFAPTTLEQHCFAMKLRQWENGDFVPSMKSSLQIETVCGIPQGAWSR